jgi:hypothetical protein
MKQARIREAAGQLALFESAPEPDVAAWLQNLEARP